MPALSRKEREVFNLLTAGMTKRQIAMSNYQLLQ